MTRDLPVFILGLDAADHLLIERWAARGDLPAFSRLLDGGAYGLLESTAAVFSGSAWVSIASACNPGKCGVYSRYQLASGTYNVRRIKATDCRVPPFWTSFRGPIVVVDVPKAPLIPGIDGIQIVEWGAYDHYSEFSSFPSDLSARVVNEFGKHPFLDRDFEVALHARRDFEALKAQLIQGIKRKQCLNLALMKEYRPRLFFSVFGETHAAGHAFWRFQDPRHPLYEPKAPLATALLDVYRAIDSAVAEFLKELPRHCIFVVISSQGFCMDTIAVEDFVCEILVRMGMSTPKLKNTRFAPYVPMMTLDMTRSRAFCLPTDLQGYIRINLRGREPNGVVLEGEYDAACQELEAEFLALRHRDNGAPVVSDVVRVRDLFKGTFSEELPDLSVIWNTDHIVKEVVSPRCGLTQRAPDLSAGGGNHRGVGFMLLHGLNVSGGRFVGNVFDFGPTISRFLDEPLRAEWDGKALPVLRKYP